MPKSNDNDIYPEYKPIADKLLQTLLGDKLPFVWDTFLIGINWQVRCILSSPFSAEKDKAYDVAQHLARLAQYCHIDIHERGHELAAILPDLKTWLCDARLLPLQDIDPSLPVFRPPTDISRL